MDIMAESCLPVQHFRVQKVQKSDRHLENTGEQRERDELHERRTVIGSTDARLAVKCYRLSTSRHISSKPPFESNWR